MHVTLAQSAHLRSLLVRLIVVEQPVSVVLGVGQELLAKGVGLFRAAVENLELIHWQRLFAMQLLNVHMWCTQLFNLVNNR